jgi:hypothetical protein
MRAGWLSYIRNTYPDRAATAGLAVLSAAGPAVLSAVGPAVLSAAGPADRAL